MPSPQQRMPREQRRDQLVGVARAVFAGRGYRTTSMDTIAEEAGVSKPVLYQHFASKQDLYLALIDDSARHLAGQVEHALNSTDDPRGRIRATYRAYFDFAISHREEFVILFNSDVYEPAAQARVRSMREGTVASIVSALQSFTDLDDAEADLLCRTLIGTAEVVIKQIEATHEIDIDATVDLLTQMSWGGLSSFATAVR